MSRVRRMLRNGILNGGVETVSRVYDSFNRADGALSNTERLDGIGRAALAKAWSGATWNVVSGKAGNTPALGVDLWLPDAAAFTSGTYGWTALGTNSIANVGNALQVTYGNNGAGAYSALSSGLNLSSSLTVNKWYKFSCDAVINTGICQMTVYTGNAGRGSVFSADITTTPSRVEIYFQCGHATNGTVSFGILGVGEVVTIDNCSLLPVTTSAELFATVQTDESDVVTYGKIGMTNGHMSGFAICLDSDSNPQNYILIRSDGKYISWDKCVNGTVTSEILEIVLVTGNWLSSADLVVEKVGTTINFYYHGKLLATKTVSDASIISNTIHGMFSASPTNTIDDFTLRPDEPYISSPNIYAIGDSITANGTWLQSVATSKKWQPIVTAHPATRILGTGQYYLAWQATAILGASTIIILMGTNDEVSDDTIRAQYQAQLAVLQASNPTARIIALGVLKRTTNNAEKILISGQIEIAAGNVGVEYSDTQDWIDPTVDCDDGLHPNALGEAKMVTRVLGLL